MNIRIILLASITAFVLNGCKNDPKVIEVQSNNATFETNSGIFSNQPVIKRNSNPSNTGEVHVVAVNEVLQGANYTYLLVKEAEEEYWIATAKKDIQIGETYFYSEALLQTNFESKEHNRVFDKIYLVTNLVSQEHGVNSENLTDNNSTNGSKSEIPSHSNEIITREGSIKIAEIVADPKKYDGKTVQISGKCVKINPGIMNRNWIHLQDGSKDEYDLVVTSDAFVPKGKIVTMKALVSINRDFGAGYKYALILENGTLID